MSSRSSSRAARDGRGDSGARLAPALACAAALLACACSSPNKPPPATAKPVAAPEGDRLEMRRDGDRVTVRLRPPRAVPARDDQLQLLLGATYSAGPGGSAPRAVLFGVRRVGKSFRFSSCRAMALSADGAVVARASVRREAQIGGGHLHELLLAPLPLATIRALSNAKRVSVQLCGAAFAIGDVELRQLRRFVAQLDAR